MPDGEPDGICPDWPWWKHWPGPRPPWWNERIVKVGEEIYAGLTLVNMAGRVADQQVSMSLARTGIEMVTKNAQEFSKMLGQTRG